MYFSLVFVCMGRDMIAKLSKVSVFSKFTNEKEDVIEENNKDRLK